jgi:hypothetical protein
MKSLTVGDFDVMSHILESTLEHLPFDWKRCKSNCGRHDHNRIWASRDAEPHGVDALRPPWTLPPDESHPYSGSRKSRRINTSGTTGTSLNTFGTSGPSAPKKLLQSDSSLSSMSSLSSLDGDEPHGLVGGRGRHGTKRKHDGRGDGSRSPTKGLTKADSVASYQDMGGKRRYVNGQSFLQQVRTTLSIHVLC